MIPQMFCLLMVMLLSHKLNGKTDWRRLVRNKCEQQNVWVIRVVSVSQHLLSSPLADPARPAGKRTGAGEGGMRAGGGGGRGGGGGGP